MNELRSLFPHQLRRFLVCGALGCLVSVPVAAQGMGPLEMPLRIDRFNVWANGNIVSTTYASPFEAESIRLAQNARIYGSSTTGGVSLSKQLALNTRNGVVVAEAVQKIGARQMAKSLAGVISGPVGIALLLAPPIIDWLSDAGVEYDGSTWRAPDPTLCTANCFRYCGLVGTSPNTSCGVDRPYQNTQLAAAQWYIGRTLGSGYGNCGFKVVTGATASTLQCEGGSTSITFATQPRQPDPPGTAPITPQQAEDLLAATDPSPSVLKELADRGITPDPDPSDPAQVLNPQPSQEKTTTKTNPDGSTETTVCQTTGTVVGNALRLNESCTTTMRDPQGNITGTTTTTTDDADPQPGQEEQSLFCELFPNVLACAEFGEPEGDDIPTEERSVDFEPELLFGNGSCPADTSITVNGTTITIGQWSSWCPYLTDYVRPMVLLLSAFMALMIVARGMPE